MTVRPRLLKNILLALVGIFVCIQLFFPLSRTRAQFAVFVAGSNPAATFVLTNPPGLNLLSSEGLKQFVLDLAARIVAGTIIRGLTNQIIGWIQGNDGENVGFVQNLDAAFRKEANLAGGEFLNNLTGIDLCTADLRGYLNISLRTPGLQQRLGCTLSGIGANAEDFFQDFTRGGWPAFLKIGLEPQNNPYGAYLIALDSKLALEDAAGRRIGLQFLAGDSFLGGRGAIRKCEAQAVVGGQAEIEPGEGGAQGPQQQRMICRTEYNTKTPGGLVADTLSKAVGSGIDFAVVADEINEAIAAIANAVINRLISETFSLTNPNTGEEETGEGLFTQDLSNLAFGAAELQGHRLVREPDGMALAADTGHDALDQIMSATSRNLFITRRQIASITDSPTSTPAESAQLAALRQTEAQQETKLITALTLKNQLLATRAKILTLKQAFQTAITAEDITNAANNIEQIAQELSSAMQNIESLDADMSVPAPPVPAGDVEQDTLTELRNATLQIGQASTILREMQSEARRLAEHASTTPQRKQELNAKIAEVDTEVQRLTDSRSAISAALSSLERAATPAAITAAVSAAITEMSATRDELQRANTLMIALVPLLKPE